VDVLSRLPSGGYWEIYVRVVQRQRNIRLGLSGGLPLRFQALVDTERDVLLDIGHVDGRIRAPNEATATRRVWIRCDATGAGKVWIGVA